MNFKESIILDIIDFAQKIAVQYKSSEKMTSLICGAIREVNYLCVFNAHVESFEYEKKKLAELRSEVLRHIEEAKKRNETQVNDEVLRWLNESDVIMEEDTKTRKKWFHGWCPDCIWQWRQGKKLAKKKQDIEDLMGRSYDFHRVSNPAEIPGIKYYAPSNFIDFESRRSTFEELVEALVSGNSNMIGLQGLGGVGKTTLALQVGLHVEQSGKFQEVICTTVSNPPDINKIQRNIAKQLNFLLEGEEELQSKALWSRIANNKGKVLIILDGIWEKLDLRAIGIPHNHQNCCVLVTTRNIRVCRAMGCQLIIHLQTLTNEEALSLFKAHTNHDDLSSSDLNGIAQDIVNECGGLPVIVTAIARTLRNRHVDEWKLALTNLRNSHSSVDVDEGLTNIHISLKLSYDYLGNEEAKKLFLLCSLFPEGYEIPISLLIRLGIGAGIFGEVEKYCEARRQALEVKTKLVASSLLLEVEKERVKMHDLVYAVAQQMVKQDTQVIMNSEVTPNPNLRFLFWSGDVFPNQFHATKLEVLLLWIKGYVKVEDANAMFEEMEGLRVLVLCCDVEKCLRLPLQSFLSLMNIRTLILNGWKLDDISVLKNIQSLETLELNDCSIIELPKEIEELKKLKLLGLKRCSIEMNNPFEVIERCSQLEGLYFVENDNVEDWKPISNRENIDKISQDISPPVLQIYSIACSGFKYFDDENGLLKCFNTEHVMNLISGSMFQYLLKKAEVLELGRMEETGWRCLVPDCIPVKDGAMNDLVKLCLYECYNIEYLIDARALVRSDMTVFSKLAELHMRDVGVRELCGGPIPSGFLEQLQVLKVSSCMKLHNIFLGGSLKLPHLKVLKLEHCSMLQPSIFRRSVAGSLAQLEELFIEDCYELSSLIAEESLKEEMVDADHQNNYDGLFPKLETLKINGCEKLQVVSPLLLAGDLPLLRDLSIKYCGKLRYIFDEYRHEGQLLHQLTLLPSLTNIDLYWVPSLINIFQKCTPPIVKDDSKQKHAKTRATDTSIAVSKAKMQQSTISLGSPASREGINNIIFTAECLLRPPLGFQNLRQMKLWEFSNIMSLFSVPIAATMMLEKLEISYCEELKHIITNEGEDYDHRNYSSIFPKLQQLDIYNCNKLEYVFPSTFSGGLQKLKYLTINGACELKYVFGKYNHEDFLSTDNENDEFHIDLPALETLSLEDVPNMISICINKYRLKFPSIKRLDSAKTTKVYMQNVTSEGAKKSEIEEIINVKRPGSNYGLNFNSLQQITITGSPRLKTMFSTSTWRSIPQLSKLWIWDCDDLRSVVEDDSKDHGHIKYSSLFPNLEDLEIRRCMNLEFLFPSPVSGGLKKLKNLVVREAPKLKYILRKYYDENESDKVQVDLSALETLSLIQVPNMINICAKEHNILKLPSLRNIALDNCQELSSRFSPDLTLYWKPAAAKDLMRIIMDQQKLTSLVVEKSIIEEVFNFEDYGEVEGAVTLNLELMRLMYLRELRYICRGRKHILSLHNLSELEIESCPKLRVVFSASMSKSLAQLSDLTIKDCPELDHIIEENDDDHLDQLSFKKLEYIDIERCHRLKCLFSISTLEMLPRLRRLEIIEAARMEQVFPCKQYDMKVMAVKDVIPTLSSLILKGLPNLVAVCGRINFETLQYVEVVDCPKYQDTTPQPLLGPPSGDSESEASTEEQTSSHSSVEKVPISRISSVTTKETLMGIEAEGSITASEEQATKALPVVSQLRMPSIHELDDELTMSEATVQLQHQDRGEAKTTIRLPHKTNTPFHDDSIGLINERVQEDLTRDDVVVAILQADLVTRNSLSAIKSIEEYKGTEKEVGNVVPALKFTTSPKLVDVQPRTEQNLIDQVTLGEAKCEFKITHQINVTRMKETVEQGFQEDDESNEAIIIRRKQSGVPLNNSQGNEFAQSIETGKNVVGMGIASQTLAAACSLNVEVASMEETLEQGFQGHDPSKDAIQSTDSVSRKQPIVLWDIAEGLTSKDVVVATKAPRKSQATLATPLNVSSAKETVEQGFQRRDGSDEAIITRKQFDFGVPLVNSLGNELAQSIETGKNVVGMEKSVATSSLNAKGASMEETQERSLQEYDASKDAIQSTESESRKQSTVPWDIAEIGQRKETVKQGLQENYALEEAMRGIESANSSDLTKKSTEPFLRLSEKDFEQIVRKITGAMKQGLQEKYVMEEAMRVIQSPTSDVTKQSTEPFLKLSEDMAKTIKETRDANVEERPMPVKATRVNLSDDVISSLHHQSQIGSASTSSSILEIGEILELVGLKDDERALLVKALELYPQLRLSRGCRPIITFAYRVLVDILIMLGTKNPYTMTEADKSTLEANLGAANYFGFDKDWVESIRAKVFDIDMFDVLATREKFLVMEAELEAHDIALRQMRKERAEAKERLAMARKQLEMAQSEFEAVDSRLLGLLVDCKKLIAKMEESGEMSAKDGPFGI